MQPASPIVSLLADGNDRERLDGAGDQAGRSAVCAGHALYDISRPRGASTDPDPALVGDAPLPFIGLGLSYDPNDVFIDVVRSSLRFADVGLTRNQRATGAAVEALGRGNVLYDTVVAGTANAAQSAFNALSAKPTRAR